MFHSGEQADQLDAEDAEGDGIVVGKRMRCQQDLFEVGKGDFGDAFVPDKPGVFESSDELVAFGP